MKETHFLDDLKPCPFCGCEELRGWMDDNDYVIECQNCATQFRFDFYVRGTASGLWNERPHQKTLNEVLDECIQLLEDYRASHNLPPTEKAG